MSENTPRWLGIIRGFKTNGRDPWQVSIEMPEGPGIFDGTGPTVNFEHGQRVHVLSDEGLAEVERAAAEKQALVGARSRAFWAMVDDSEELGCWPWKGSRKGEGELYGGFDSTLAHRFAWTLCNGPIPAGMVVRHKCDNPICVKPAHLEIGTQRQNVADMMERRRGWFQKGVCRNGHERTESTIHVRTDGVRACLTCLELTNKRRAQIRRTKRVVCSECGKEMGADNLKRHMRTHGIDVPYSRPGERLKDNPLAPDNPYRRNEGENE